MLNTYQFTLHTEYPGNWAGKVNYDCAGPMTSRYTVTHWNFRRGTKMAMFVFHGGLEHGITTFDLVRNCHTVLFLEILVMAFVDHFQRYIHKPNDIITRNNNITLCYNRVFPHYQSWLSLDTLNIALQLITLYSSELACIFFKTFKHPAYLKNKTIPALHINVTVCNFYRL